MKTNIFLLILSVALMACNSNTTNESDTNLIEFGDGKEKEAKFDFKETDWDFGTLTQGEIVEHSFKFTNVGNEPLVISSVRASCGCTVPDYSREPIKPGKTGVIKVSFDSNNKSNAVTNDVTITANTVPVTTKLSIKAFVKK